MASTSLLKDLARSLMIEGRVEDVQKKYPNVDVGALVAGQPGGTNNKYLEWCAKMVSQGEPITLVLANAAEFHANVKRMEKKDINAYKSVGELQAAIPKKEVSKAQKAAEIKKTADRVYEDDHFLVVRPNTRAASCMYGAGTRWCTAASSGNQFKNYSSRNARFYYVIDKTKPDDKEWSKVAYVKVDLGSGSYGVAGDVGADKDVDIYNAQDTRVTIGDFRKQMGPEFAKVEKTIQAFDDANKESWHKKMLQELPIEQVQQMWKTFDEEEKLELLKKSPSLRPQDFMRFAKSPNALYRKTIAERKDVGEKAPEVIAVLAQDPEVAIRLTVIERADLPEDLLAHFVNDESANVRLALAKNKKSGPLLGALTRDKVQPVRLAAYSNPSLDPALFAQIPDDPDPYIRLGVLRHAKKFPPGVLERLKNDSDPVIADRARKVT